MITAEKLAGMMDAEVMGPGDTVIKGLAPIMTASEGDITFATDENSMKAAASSPASCVLSPVGVPGFPKTMIIVDDMKAGMTMLYTILSELKPAPKGEVHPSSVVDPSSDIGENVTVGPNAVIEEGVSVGKDSYVGPNCFIGAGSRIGERTRINANVSVYDNMVIGNRVIIHSGTIIGADGFGFVPKGGKLYKVPQMGRVVIEDNVEIGANSCVDRGTFGDTVISEGCKIDNLVQVAHNVKLEKNVILAGQTGISGSTTIGENTVLGGQVGVSDHVRVGKNVKAGAKTGIRGHVGDGEIVFGYPHRTSKEAKMLFGLQGMFIKQARDIKDLLKSLSGKKQ